MTNSDFPKNLYLEEKLQEEAYMQQQYEEELQWQAELDKIREENYNFEYGDYKY